MTRGSVRILRSVVLGVLMGSMACAGAPPPSVTPLPPGPIGLQPGDAVAVRIWQEPDLSGEFMVAQDGRIVFPLLGAREVLGVSPEEVRSRLITEFGKYLVNPSIDVTVLRRIAILGEVRSPGLHPVDPTMSLTDALAQAGGLSPTADKNDIRLVRGGNVLIQSMAENQVIGSTVIRSGDQIVVGEQGWARRNAMFITAGLGAATSILVAFILVGGR